MTPIVVPAPTCKAVDASSKLTDALLDELAARGYAGVFRYVPLPGVDPRNDVDPVELERVLAHPNRFWSAWVQHPRYPGWRPRDCDARADAQCAAAHAHAAGYGDGVTGYVDLEGMGLATSEGEAFDFAALWLEVVLGEGFTPGAYWGYQQPVPPERRGLVGAKTHWSDAGRRVVTGRGVAVYQGAQFAIFGTPLDPDDVAPDAMGETPLVMRAAPSSAPPADVG